MAAINPTSKGSGLFTKEMTAHPHLIKHGTGGEVGDLRLDLAKTVKPLAAIAIDEFTNPPTGSTLALSKKPLARAGATLLIREIVDGVLVTTGTISAVPATGASHGLYTPVAAPNGAHKYAVYYEYDATVA